MIVWTFQECWVNLVHFMFVFLVIFCTFALGAHWLFGHMLLEWSGAMYSISSSFRALMGDFDFMAMYRIAPISAMCWFLLFMSFIFMVLLNQFVAIIMDAWQAVQTRVEEAEPSAIVRSMSSVAMKMTGIGKGQPEPEVVCSKCGHLSKSGANFCWQCGAALSEEEDVSRTSETVEAWSAGHTAGKGNLGGLVGTASESDHVTAPLPHSVDDDIDSPSLAMRSTFQSSGSGKQVVMARQATSTPTIMAKARPASRQPTQEH